MGKVLIINLSSTWEVETHANKTHRRHSTQFRNFPTLCSHSFEVGKEIVFCRHYFMYSDSSCYQFNNSVKMNLMTLLFISLTLFIYGEVDGHLYCNKDRWVYSLRAEDEMATSGYQEGDILRSPDTLASCSTKCQMNDNCETFAFDREDFKCQLINEAVLEDNDLVSHIANQEARGYKVYQPDCGDGNKGGWWLLFKAGRGTGREFHSDFDTDGEINTSPDIVHVKEVGNKALFHHGDLDTWGTTPGDTPKFVTSNCDCSTTSATNSSHSDSTPSGRPSGISSQPTTSCTTPGQTAPSAPQCSTSTQRMCWRGTLEMSPGHSESPMGPKAAGF